MIGQQISPILEEIELALLEFEINLPGRKPQYTDAGFLAATIIFSSVCQDKMWELMEREKMTFEDRCNMSTKLGEEIRKLIQVYCDIDTREMVRKVNGIDNQNRVTVCKYD